MVASRRNFPELWLRIVPQSGGRIRAKREFRGATHELTPAVSLPVDSVISLSETFRLNSMEWMSVLCYKAKPADV